MKMVYVSHPYGGLKENEKSADYITKILANTFPEIAFISPIHAIRCDYKTTPYTKGLQQTIEILKRSDAIFMSPGWKTSKGCKAERKVAKRMEIPIIYEMKDIAIWYAISIIDMTSYGRRQIFRHYLKGGKK